MAPLPALAEGLTSLGTLLLGGTLARRVLTPGHPGRSWLGVGGGLLLLGAALEVGGTLRTLGFLTPADALAYLTATGPGRAALTRALGGTLLLAAELAAWPVWTLALPVGLLLWGVAGGGHGGAHGPGLRVLTALHTGAMVAWLGGVLALLTWPRLTAASARPFTPVALGGVATLIATGLPMTGSHAGSVLALPHSGYGRLLLLKLALFGLALLAATLVRRTLARSGRFRRVLALETALLLGVLGVTAVLGTTPPPAHGEHGPVPSGPP